MIYTSRYSNPELKSGKYTAVRISVGSPRWNVGYNISGAISELMPKGIFGKFDNDPAGFEVEYRKRLECVGVEYIRKLISSYELLGRDVVLLCYEDVRKPTDWCHRTIFAKWWQEKTGEIIPELPDPSPVKGVKAKKTENTQMTMFDS